MKLPKEFWSRSGGGWNELKTNGGGWKGGGGGIIGPGPRGEGNAGNDGGGEILLLLLFVGFCLSLNLFNQSLRAKSCHGGPGAGFIRLLAKTFFPTSSSLSREPTIVFSASKVEISSKASSNGLCLLKIFLLIGASFCQKLALIILSLVT